MNLGVIDAIEWSALQDPTSIALLDSALKHYTDAANLATSSLLLSTAYNNLGDVSLQRGRWYAERAQLDQAREALSDAKRHIRRALAQAEPQPVG